MVGTAEDVQQILKTMQQNRNTIEEEIAMLVFYMEGGLDFNDAYALSSLQRQRLAKVIEQHYEKRAASKSLL